MLTGVSISFETHDQNKDANTVVHVFVKNRLTTTEGTDPNSDFISNLLASQRYLPDGDLTDHASSPFLAYGVGLGATFEFDRGDVNTFPLTLMPQPVTVDDLILPAVSVHILPHGNSRWIFDYKVTFTFDDDTLNFSFHSRLDGGLPGIILDQDNRNFYGLCAENPHVPVPVPGRPASKSALRQITLDIFTHDDDKNENTRLDIEIVNRLNATTAVPIAVGENLFPGVHFDDRGPIKTVTWPAPDGSLTLTELLLADVVLPQVNITMQAGEDRWIFDYRVTMEFADPDDFNGKSVIYSWQTSGVILDQDNNVHFGIYSGPGFPTVAARPAPPLVRNPDPITRTKPIPLSLVRAKLDEFINNRNGLDTDQNPPLRKIRLHNAGVFNADAFPETYVDARSITAVRGGVDYVSSPTSLGQLNAAGITNTIYFIDVNSDNLSVSLDSADPPVLTLDIHFETKGSEETGGLFDVDFTDFSIKLKLTLAKLTHTDGRTIVDALHWMTELDDLANTATPAGKDPLTGLPLFHYVGPLLDQHIDTVSFLPPHAIFIDQLIPVHLTTSETTDPQGELRGNIRDGIFDALTRQDPITKRTARDGINSMVTSWLLGGVTDDDHDQDGHNTVLTDIHTDGDSLMITYAGPQNVFVPDKPSDWPSSQNPNPAWDFAPGTLSNIDHIVVLTMENRSFDHMLGYLSLPVAQGGMGRTDVDGLTGNESNSFRGTTYPTTPVTETFFSPDPPHGFQPTHRAINGGLMDGFVQEYAAQNGAAIAGSIMRHQTGATVPTYDGLARDFAIGHRWFASHPGPTFCNRFYELTGWLNLDPGGFWEFDNSSPLRPVFTKTIFDYLSATTNPDTGQPYTWTYYEQGYCFLRFFENYTFDNEHIVDFHDPQRGFVAMAQAGTLPSVTFIDPHFIELPPGANADGVPADVKDGQPFVRSVVEAVVASPAWDKTLLVVVYDEHGGFYDHVPPSAAAKVSPELPIETHGVRVPAFVISPWVAAGKVFGHDAVTVSDDHAAASTQDETQVPATVFRRSDLHFDHTSILRTIARRFMSADPPYLGARYAAANDLSAVVTTVKRQTQFRPFLRYNFQFGASQLMLGVKDANPAPGAALWQLPVDGSTAQDFSFEDAGNGFWYIRSHVSGLYMTLQPPATAPVADAAGPIPLPQPIPPGVIQDVKFVPGTASAAATVDFPAAERQQWSLTAVSAAIGPDLFLVHNRAAPGLVLQPTVTAQAGPVVLRAVPLGSPPGTGAWKVTSPALNH
jgi:phospholipase C